MGYWTNQSCIAIFNYMKTFNLWFVRATRDQFRAIWNSSIGYKWNVRNIHHNILIYTNSFLYRRKFQCNFVSIIASFLSVSYFCLLHLVRRKLSGNGVSRTFQYLIQFLQTHPCLHLFLKIQFLVWRGLGSPRLQPPRNGEWRITLHLYLCLHFRATLSLSTASTIVLDLPCYYLIKYAKPSTKFDKNVLYCGNTLIFSLINLIILLWFKNISFCKIIYLLFHKCIFLDLDCWHFKYI